MPNENIASVQANNGYAECPSCHRWARVSKEGGTIVLYCSCAHYRGIFESDGRMYIQFAGASTCA